MADLTLGNQNETPQDLQKLEGDLLAAIGDYAKAVENGQPASKFLGGGNDYNVVTEGVAVAKSGMAGMAMTALSESLSEPTPNSRNTTSIFGSGGGGGKRNRRLERLTSNNDAMGMPKSYSQKKDDARELQRMRSGVFKKSKDPMAASSSSLSMTGEKISGTSFAAKPAISAEAIKSNPDLVRGIGGGQLADTLTATRYEKDHEGVEAVLVKAINGDEGKQNALKNIQESQVQQSLKKVAPSVKNTLKNQIKLPEPKPPTWASSEGGDKGSKSSS